MNPRSEVHYDFPSLLPKTTIPPRPVPAEVGSLASHPAPAYRQGRELAAGHVAHAKSSVMRADLFVVSVRDWDTFVTIVHDYLFAMILPGWSSVCRRCPLWEVPFGIVSMLVAIVAAG